MLTIVHICVKIFLFDLEKGVEKMKKYQSPILQIVTIIQADKIANTPWGSFAPSLDELGGTITSYDYGSGVQVE